MEWTTLQSLVMNPRNRFPGLEMPPTPKSFSGETSQPTNAMGAGCEGDQEPLVFQCAGISLHLRPDSLQPFRRFLQRTLPECGELYARPGQLVIAPAFSGHLSGRLEPCIQVGALRGVPHLLLNLPAEFQHFGGVAEETESLDGRPPASQFLVHPLNQALDTAEVAEQNIIVGDRPVHYWHPLLPLIKGRLVILRIHNYYWIH